MKVTPSRETIAILLWHRFAPESHVEWEDEPHKAEYLDAADAVLFRILGTLTDVGAPSTRPAVDK